MEHTEFSILLLNGCAKHRSLWMCEQRLLELHSVWVGINTLLAFEQWMCGFELSPSKFHLVWFLPSISCFSTSVDGKTDSSFQQVYFPASSSLLLPAPSWLFLTPVWGQVVAQAPPLSSRTPRELQKLCVFHSALGKSPRGGSHPASVRCSSLGGAKSWSELTKCCRFNYSWCAVNVLPPGGCCSSCGRVSQDTGELQAPEPEGCCVLLCLGIFRASIHAGMQLEGVEIKVGGMREKGALC